MAKRGADTLGPDSHFAKGKKKTATFNAAVGHCSGTGLKARLHLLIDIFSQ